ncbi:MAG: sensor histidine kinase [Actinomycetota bacterium]
MKGFPLRARIVLGACVVGAAAYLVLPATTGALWYDAMGVATIVAMFVGAAKRPPGRRAGWNLLAAGMVAWVGGDVVWSLYEVAGTEAPYPGLGDAVYLCAYPLWTAGALLLVRRRGGRADVLTLVDAAIVTVAAALLGWVLLIQPQGVTEQPGLLIAVSLAYPLGDVLLLAVLSRMLLGPGQRSTSSRFLMAAIAVTLVSDLVYAVAMLGDWYALVIDAGWLLSYGFWAAAALSPSPDAPTQSVALRGWRRLAPLAAAAIAIPVLDIVESLRAHDDNEIAIALGTFVMFALVGTRVALMITRIERDSEDLATQGRTLRRALDDLSVVQAERTRLLDQTVRATEEERSRVAVDLHDGPIQHLTALGFRMGTVRARLRSGGPDGAQEAIELVERDIGDSIGELRRLMSDLRPPALDEGGLEAALRDQTDIFRTRTGADVTFDARLAGELDVDTQVVLYRITQEALANVARHAGARHVEVRLSTPNNHATLEVSDDGVGFEEDRIARFARDGHFGLAGMEQRASMIGGRLEIRSAPGGGTRVVVDVPIRKTDA